MSLLLLLLVLPLAASATAYFPLGRRLPPAVTLIACVGELGLSVAAATMISSSVRIVAVPNWLELDGFSALVLVLVALVSTTGALFSWGYMAREADDGHLRRYYVNYNFFVWSMLAVPMLVEPALVWTAAELTTILGVYLVAFDNTHESVEAAWKYSILTIMGGAVALLGFIVLHSATRYGEAPFTWTGLVALAPHVPAKILRTAFLLILFGFGAKVGLVPLHTWLPDTHSQAPSPVCALLSGVKTTVVLYVILRMIPVLEASGAIDPSRWTVPVGLVSVGVAAFLILQVSDYKRLFAYSTVEHMGIILTAAGLGSTAACYGAVFQILTHALTKSFCFFAAGMTLLAVETRSIASVRGLLQTAPATAIALLVGAIAIAGAPPLVVFLSEFSVLRAAVFGKHYVAVALLALFIAVAFFGMLYHVSRMVFGDAGTTESPQCVARPPLSCVLTVILSAAPVILLGFYLPAPLDTLLKMAAQSLSR